MDTDLRQALRAILKEELEPIQHRLDNIDQRLDASDQRLDTVDGKLDIVDEKLSTIAKDVGEIKNSHETLQQNLVDSIGQYTDEIIKYVDDRTEALNKRVYHTEIGIQRLNKQ